MNSLLAPQPALTIIPDTTYYVIVGLLTLVILLGISFMSKVKLARLGNQISAVAMLFAIALTLINYEIIPVWSLYIFLLIGSLIGALLAIKVKMIQMPQLVALLNGLGGLASLIVGGYAYLGVGAAVDPFSQIAAVVAMIVGSVTFSGSLVAAGKLHRILPQKPIVVKGHQLWAGLLLLLLAFAIVLPQFINVPKGAVISASIVFALSFGILFSIRVGGADMPITISLLNSFSGIAGAVSGLAIGEVLLVTVGGIVGASGLLLTQIMCKAMNRSLLEILLGKSTATPSERTLEEETQRLKVPSDATGKVDPFEIARNAKNVIIVPGYGMAIAQAQHLVKQLGDKFSRHNAKVRYAIHPVAGRMPGHMNVLLAEADVDYDDLFEMDEINDDFAKADLTIVVGANDVINPSAREAQGTPIYGMPILNVDKSPQIFIFNYDLQPGYAGVKNPLYERASGVHLFLGNAADTLKDFLEHFE
jgi:NAD(P) transhydrogenase subunit beta